MNLIINAREGNPYETPEGIKVKISDTMRKITHHQTQDEALRELGIKIENHQLIIEFSETGNAYVDPGGNRTKIAPPSTQIVKVNLHLKFTPPSILQIKTSAVPFVNDGVNFFGYVMIETPEGEIRNIPITGRGTVALEGKESGDIHAGIVTGGACASFQARVAIVLAVVAAAGTSKEQIDTIGKELRKLNSRYHGRGDILTYTIEAAKTSEDSMQSYTQFMAKLYPAWERSNLLQSIIETGEPNKIFYEKVKHKMTPEEIIIDNEETIKLTTKLYLKEFCEYFANEIEEKFLKFHPFSRSFEEEPNAIQNDRHHNLPGNHKPTNLEQVFQKQNQRILLLGEPGTGKTVLLRRFAKSQALFQLNNNSKILPIFATIRTWNGAQNESIFDWLVNQAKIIYPELDPDLLEQQIKAKQVLLLLDGLDELPFNITDSRNPNAKRKDYRTDFIAKLIDFESEYGNNQMIVTCRLRDYEEIISQDQNNKLNLNGAFVLKRLSYQEIKSYLDSIFSEQPTFLNKLWNILTKNFALLKMVRTPFLLTVLVSPHVNKSENIASETEHFRKISNTDQLFDLFLESSYKRENNKNRFKLPYSLEEFKQILGQVAVLMMSDSRPDDNEIFPDIFERAIPEEYNIDNFIDFTQNLYLLIPNSSQKQNIYRFRHLLLQDYFAFHYAFNSLQNIPTKTNQTQNRKNYPTKIELAIALGKLNRLRATDLLIDLLKDPNKDVRYEAANSLGELDAGVYFRGYRQDFSAPYLISHSLSGFDNQSIKQYFDKSTQRKVTELEVEKIAEFSLGIPFVVQQIALAWDEYEPEEILAPVSKGITKRYKTPSEQVIATAVDRFLIHCEQNKQDKKAVYILAMMRRPDKCFLQEMLGVKDVKGKLEELYESYSFILPEQLKLDGKYAKFLQENLLISEQRTSPLVLQINQEAINYFRSRLKKIIQTRKLTTIQQRLEDEGFIQTFSDLAHHKLWWTKQENEGLDYLIPYLVEGWYYNNTDWVLSLLEIAAQFTSPKNELLQVLKLGLAVSASEENKYNLLNEFEEAFDRRRNKNENWETQEWKALVLLKCGDLLLNRGKYSEAIEKYKRAKEYLSEECSDLRKHLKDGLRASSAHIEPTKEIESYGSNSVEKIDLPEEVSPNKNSFLIQISKQNPSLFLGIIIGLLLAIIVLLSVILGFNILLYFS